MLDQLDEIPWKDLNHAYGSAAGVPACLRTLGRGSVDEQENALFELYATICHQGTVYEATSYTVPFLVELAACPEGRKRERILGLISMLAAGESYLRTHSKLVVYGHDLRQEPGFEERLSKEVADVERTRSEILRYESAVLKMLRDFDPMVRVSAASVLARFPEKGPEFAEAICRQAMLETNSLVSAGMLWCLSILKDSSPHTIAFLQDRLQHTADLRQSLIAAIALRRMNQEISKRGESLLCQLAATRWLPEKVVSGLPWDSEGEINVIELTKGYEPDPEGATSTLLNLLALPDEYRSFYWALMHDLLTIHFGEECSWREANPLSKAQLFVLQQIVGTTTVWRRDRGMYSLLREGGLRGRLTVANMQSIRGEMISRIRDK